MKPIYDLIRKPKLVVPEKFKKKGLQINYIGISETGREVYMVIIDEIRHPLQYDRENDDFYTQGWVKVAA